jgi:hypothetical protein
MKYGPFNHSRGEMLSRVIFLVAIIVVLLDVLVWRVVDSLK